MKTIDLILEKYDFSKEEIINLETKWICNWCGGKGWFNFSKFLDKISTFKNFNSEKFINFKNDLKIICCIHDYQYSTKSFYKNKNFFDFLSYNYQLAINILLLLHWTSVIRRLIVFISVFGWTSLFGWKYFNK